MSGSTPNYNLDGPAFQTVALSEEGGDTLRDFDIQSIAYSTLSERSQSTTLPQSQFYENLVGNFKESKDRRLLEKQINIIKETWALKIEKWEESKQQLMRTQTTIDPLDPLILKIEKRILKGRHLCKIWTEEISNILKAVISEEFESEAEGDLFKSVPIIDIEDGEEVNKEKLKSADIFRQTQEWVQSTPISSENPNTIISISEETAEFSTPVSVPTKSGPAQNFKESAEPQTTVPKVIEDVPPKPEETQSLIEALDELLDKPVKTFRQVKEKVGPLRDIAVKTQTELNFFRKNYEKNQVDLLKLKEKTDGYKKNDVKLKKDREILKERVQELESLLNKEPKNSEQTGNPLLISEIHKLQIQIKESQDLIMKLEAEVLTKSQEKDVADSKLKEKEEELRETQKGFNRQELEIIRTRKEAEGLQMKLNYATNDPEINRQLIQSFKDKEELGKELIMIKDENKELSIALKELELKNLKLSSDNFQILEALKKEKENYQKINDHLREKGDNIKRELEEMREKHDNLAQSFLNPNNTIPKTTIPNSSVAPIFTNQNFNTTAGSIFDNLSGSQPNNNIPNTNSNYFDGQQYTPITTNVFGSFGLGGTTFSTPSMNTQTTNTTSSGVPLMSFNTPITSVPTQTSATNFINSGGAFSTSNLFSTPITTTTQPNFQNTVPTTSQSTSGPNLTQPFIGNRNPSIKPKVPTFDGEFEKAVEWYDEFRDIASHYQWTEEEMVKYARMNMTGSAKHWFTLTFTPIQDIDLLPYTTKPLPTWTEFSEKFLKEYRPEGSEIYLRKKLQNITKTPTETYIAYARRVLCLIRNIDPKMSQSEQVMHIREGLKRDPIINQIKAINKLDPLKEYFINYDQGNTLVRTSYRYQTRHEYSPAEDSERTETSYKPNQRVKNIDIQCVNCLKKGHFWKQCPQPLTDKRLIDQRLAEFKDLRTGKQLPKSDGHKQNAIRVDPDEDRVFDNEPEENDQSSDKVPQVEQKTEKVGLTSIILCNYRDNSASEPREVLFKRSAREFGSPLIFIKIGDKNFKAMVDTGSSLSFIKEEILDEIDVNKSKDLWPYSRLSAVDNRDITPKYILTRIKISYSGRDQFMSLGIMSELPYALILGMDFLQKFKLGIDIPKGLAYFSDVRAEKTKRLVEENRKLKDQINSNQDSIAMPKPRISLKKLVEKVVQSKKEMDKANECDKPLPIIQKDEPIILNCSVISCAGANSENIWPEISEEIIEKPKMRKIIPRINSEYIFGPSERRIITTRLDDTHPGLFITKTLKNAKRNGWAVEKGITTADNKVLKVWVQNRLPRPRKLKVGDSLFQLNVTQLQAEDLIEIKTPEPPMMSAKQRRRKEILERNKPQDYDSYNRKIWEKLSSVPNAEVMFLTPFERGLAEDDQYFVQNIDTESFEKWNVSPDLSPKHKYMFWRLLERYRGIFAFKGDPLGKINNWVHHIDTGEHPPIKQNPYRTSEAQKLQIQECVNDMMEKGVIVPCVSSWSSPVTLVPKKDGTIRFCIDYRKLNAITKDDLYPIPRLDEPLALMRGSKLFSVMDCDSCYWQIPLDRKSMEKTTFTCHLGTFMFKVMPFGLKCAPASCVRAMDRIFKNENRRISFIYMDDLICYSDTPEEHIRRLSILFDRMMEHGLKLKAKKCEFANNSVNYLGHTITVEGISPDRNRLKALLESPAPNSVDNVRSFLGFCGFYRNYVINFTMIAEPLTRLLRKNANFVWGEEQQVAHQTLINALINAPILAHYDPAQKTELRVDASNLGLGAHLVQIDGDRKQLLACASRTLLKHERNYSTTEKECLAIVFGLKKFRPYLFGRKFTVVTDHCGLCYLMSAKDLENRLARWSLKVMDYDFEIIYNKGAKHQDADYLSRNPFKEKEVSPEILEKEPDLTVSLVRFEIEAEPIDFTDWTPQNTIEEQKKDPILKDFYNLCEHPELLSQNYREKFSRTYQLKDGLLYRRSNMLGADKFMLCVPLSLVPQILFYAHDSPIAAHFGQRKTMWRIAQNFHWRGMATDIKNYVRTCKECQFRKTSNTSTHSYLGSLPIPHNVFDAIAIDIVGPLPTTEDGYKHIVTVTDSLSKYAVTYPIRNSTDDEIMEGLEQKVFYVFGPPKSILKDQGTNLNSVFCHQVYDRWGIKSNRTTPYHPQGNGQTERFNKTLGVALTTMIPENKEQWIEYLYPVTYGYNSVLNESTGFPPIELITGHNPQFSLLDKIGYCPESDKPGLTIEEKRRVARDNILKSQRKNAKANNEKRIPCNIKLGDLVLIFSTPLKMKKGGKFENRWIGPYRVLKRESEQIFTIMPLTGPLTKTRQVNAVNIKRYFDRKDFKLSSQI